MLYSVVVVMQVVHVMNVVVVKVGSLQSLASSEVLLSTESVFIDSWLILLSVLWHFGGDTAERSDLGSLSSSQLGG